jgi:hypothetical protein
MSTNQPNARRTTARKATTGATPLPSSRKAPAAAKAPAPKAAKAPAAPMFHLGQWVRLDQKTPAIVKAIGARLITVAQTLDGGTSFSQLSVEPSRLAPGKAPAKAKAPAPKSVAKAAKAPAAAKAKAPAAKAKAPEGGRVDKVGIRDKALIQKALDALGTNLARLCREAGGPAAGANPAQLRRLMIGEVSRVERGRAEVIARHLGMAPAALWDGFGPAPKATPAARNARGARARIAR